MTEQENNQLDQRRMFEYERLQERIRRDSEASYTLMTALIALSEAIFAAVLLNFQNLQGQQLTLLSASIASISSLLIWYPIDRRFVWAEMRRLARVKMIEEVLTMYNERLFAGKEIDNPDVEDAIEEADSNSGVWARISIHHIFLLFCTFMVFAWVLLIIEGSSVG